MCIRTLAGAKSDAAQIGQTILGSVKNAIPNGTVKKKEIVRAVIIRQRKPYQREDGTSIRFDDNAVVLVDPDGSPRGSRIFGPIAREVKDNKFTKIASLATEVI
jgi:large subunit ribosomal protein L14